MDVRIRDGAESKSTDSSSSMTDIRDDEETELSVLAIGISLKMVSMILGSKEGVTNSLPRPLEPSAILKLSRSFLICIATC